LIILNKNKTIARSKKREHKIKFIDGKNQKFSSFGV